MLIERCIPSVQAQTYPHVEHIVVSDGPDPDLGKLLTEVPVVYAEVAEHHRHPQNWGSQARNLGLRLASGELVAYLDDDNAWRPEHLERLVAALTAAPTAEFAYSRMLVHPHGYEVGAEPPSYGQIDSSLLMHWRGLPERLGRWPLPGGITHYDQHAPDWAVVSSWLAGGAGWVFVPEVTVDYYHKG